MSDPGLVVLPTHRLFVEPAVATVKDLVAKLGDAFTVRPVAHGPEAADAVWEEIETENEQGTLGLYTAGDQTWSLARITPSAMSSTYVKSRECRPLLNT